jgi:tRNA G18 (ribose-2'-O)-methylase SpoU
MIVIDDPHDERVAAFRLNERGLSNRPQRRDDRGSGLFMAEGDLVVERALAAGCRAVMALVDPQRPPPLVATLEAACPVYAGGEAVRAAITKLGMPYTVVALFERPARPAARELTAQSQRLVIAEAVDNPVNIGSIARNALALGCDGLVVDETSADPLSRRSLRVSMGNALLLPHARTADLPGLVGELGDDGFVVCALTPAHDATPLDAIQPTQRMALLVGSERAGLSAAALAAATHRVCVPMHGGVDSLNVAAASAIAFWHLRLR